MIILQGNTYLLPIQVGDCNDNVITADRVAKGQFIFGKYEKFYSEEGEVQWSDELQAFLFPLTEQETFELNGVIKYQARLLLNDGSVSGSVPENYYVYESITKSIISNGEVGQESGNLLKVKLVMPVVSENNGSCGTSDYNQLENKPKINGVTLEGNKTTEELGIVSKESDPTVPEYVKNITQDDINNWNGKADKGYVDMVDSIARGANQALSFDNYELMIDGLYGDNGSYNIGQNIMIVTLNVPDLWISNVDNSHSINYEYTTDDAFVNELKTNGRVQIGSYYVSALETQKVDLTDYLNENAIQLTLKDNGAYTLTINKG